MTPNDLRVVVFDFDGVLFDSQRLMRHALASSASACGVAGEPPYDRFFKLMGKPLEEILTLLDLPVAMAPIYRAVSREHLHLARPFDGVHECLAALSRRGLRFALMTGKDRERTEEILERFNLTGWFETMVCGNDPLPSKPDPGGLLAVLDRLGTAPAHALMLGDSALDIQCARRAGVLAVGAQWGFSAASDLVDAGAARVFADVAEFTRWVTCPQAADLRPTSGAQSSISKLAIHGGSQACPPGTIPRWPIHDADEADGLARVLASGQWWRMVPGEVDAFESELAAFLDCQHVLAVSSGTAALELALAAVGVGAGDEVIVPGFTFAATATAVVAVGAVPVVVDVDPTTYNINVARVAEAITPRTRAIVPVHMAGQPCEMAGLQELAARHRLRLVADAAHAHGARWRDRSVVGAAEVSIYSFQAFKLMSAGEGGALATNDRELVERAWLRHSCGRPRGDRAYRHLVQGSNHRMTEFQGAILRAQLRRLPDQLAQRELAAARLDGLLGELPGLRPMSRARDTTLHAHYMYMVRIDADLFGATRNEVVEMLLAEGVPIYRAYRTIADLELFHGGALWGGQTPAKSHREAVEAAVARHSLDVTRAIADDAIWIHHAALLGDATVQQAVAAAFHKVHEHARRQRRQHSKDQRLTADAK